MGLFPCEKESYHPFADWGNLVFFDTQEHQIPNEFHELVTIPKLETQWKILYDVKRTEHLQVENPRKYYVALGIDVGRDAFVRAAVSPPQIISAVLTTSSKPERGNW